MGSAVGFLRAPISYEVVRSRYMRLDGFDANGANRLLEDMSREARAVVEAGAVGAKLTETRLAYMRYVGQGHEITVPLPDRPLVQEDNQNLLESFNEAYTALYGQTVPGMQPEILSWTLTVSTEKSSSSKRLEEVVLDADFTAPTQTRELFDATRQEFVTAGLFDRFDLKLSLIHI